MRKPRPLLAGSAIAAMVVSAQTPWWNVTFKGMTGMPVAGSVTGQAATGGMTGMLPAVVLAALLATLMLGRVGTRVMAVAAMLAGAGMALLGLCPVPPTHEVAGEKVAGAVLAMATSPVATFWPIVYGVMGVGVAAASVWLFILPPAGRTRVADRTGDAADPIAAWKAMDAGVDPTRDITEQPEHPAPEEERTT